LRAALNDEDESVRRSAAKALRSIQARGKRGGVHLQ
jgi:HEAT repeat protein